MSGVVGKSAVSWEKGNVKESELLVRGVKVMVFAHQATGTELFLDFRSLTAPPDMVSIGFIQPPQTDINGIDLVFMGENLEVVSAINNQLIPYIDYVVYEHGIKFTAAYTPAANEIFLLTYNDHVTTANMIVDARPLVVSGTLLAGTTDFVVGQLFPVNNRGHQTGSVAVYRGDPQLKQTRNMGNDPLAPASGDYTEVDPGTGYSSMIRFNTPAAVGGELVTVLSVGSLVERPNISMMQVIEAISGTVDQVAADCSVGFGFEFTEPGRYNTRSTSIDLRNFSLIVSETAARLDVVEPQVTQNTTDIAALQAGTIPSGMMMPSARNTVPVGWLLCDGSAVDRATYADLYTAIGDSFGSGDGATTFNVPDSRGLFMRGRDRGAGRDIDVATRTASAPGGNTGDAIGSLQGDEFKTHSHTVESRSGTNYDAGSARDADGAPASGPITTTAAGGSETRPKNFYADFMIKT